MTTFPPPSLGPASLSLLRHSCRRAIERAVEAGDLTQEEIAREFGVGKALVWAAAMFVRGSTKRGPK